MPVLLLNIINKKMIIFTHYLLSILRCLNLTSLVLFCVVSLPSYALTVDGIDLTATMKQMRFEYTQAMKTDSVDVFNRHIQQFKHQLTIAQEFKFTKERELKAAEGLNKVAAVLNSIPAIISEQNLVATKEQLAVIEQLRDQYHDKKPSLWERFLELIFGEDENNEKLILLDE